MPRRLADWWSRLLGRPGSVSFARFSRHVRIAAELAAEMRPRSTAELRAAARDARASEERDEPEALGRYLAAVRETATRSLGLTPTDEQLLACCALLTGHAVDLATGEGKTLAGALAAAGHALAGRGVHVLSVNDYLAERDAAWMGPFFRMLGIDIAWIGQRTEPHERRAAYRRSVVYAPISEIGFDVLRDRLVTSPRDRVSPGSDVALVDEADSIMIDEALTPLVLAAASDLPREEIALATQLGEGLVPGRHYTVSADRATVTLTDAGIDRVEEQLGGDSLYGAVHTPLLTQIHLALHARELLQRDVDYLVRDGAVQLITAHRGRVAPLQRWPDGLQAAVEAKERVPASQSGTVLDSLTIQDLLLRYQTLSGMSGTAREVATELLEFYALPSGEIPRHVPNARIDEPDRVFLSGAERTAAAVAEIAARHATGQPVLVGTHSVAESDALALRLREAGVTARVLNAREDAEEAWVIARAGEIGAVTVSTQMSGRGTDIRLGGESARDAGRVAELGGLAVIALGRSPSARLDRQLRGRAGRQGDPGMSVAFVSLDDELVRAHAPRHLLRPFFPDDPASARPPRDPHRMRRVVDAAQEISAGVRSDRHRATWVYTRAIAAQRAAVLRVREEVLCGDEWLAELGELVPTRLPRGAALTDTVRAVMLHALDAQWSVHLTELQEIRDGIHLRALAGQRPEDEFHRIALREFDSFRPAVAERTRAFLADLEPADLGRDPAALGLPRPSATWTYMVRDDPFGAPMDRFASGLGSWVRSRVYRIE